MAFPIFSLISGLFSSGKEVYKTYQDGKVKIEQAKQELSLAKIKAEQKRYELQSEATTNWDMEAMRQSQFSWKDEALMVILFLPFLGAFIPILQPYIQKGFAIISTLPLWYQLSLVGIIAASFGLRWLFQGKVNKLQNVTNITEGNI